MNDTTITILLQAIVAVLGATGLITADEGTALSGYAFSAITGTIGLVEVVRAIMRRRRLAKARREVELCGNLVMHPIKAEEGIIND